MSAKTTTSVAHHPSQCIGTTKCGTCVSACPFGAIQACGDLALIIEESHCTGPCADQHGNQLRPCQSSCSSSLQAAGQKGSIALPTKV